MIRHGGSDRKTFSFPVSVLSFFDFRVQFEVQNQKPENPHKIKENEETSFVVQTQGVQIAKDVSDGRGRRTRTLGTRFWSFLQYFLLHFTILYQTSCKPLYYLLCLSVNLIFQDLSKFLNF